MKITAFQMRISAVRQRLHDDMTMDAMMREWPATIRVVLDHGLLCVGCPVAPFHTIADAAREHDLDRASLARDLKRAIAEEDTGNG
jgi:hybrid cluster-associated redox disulfide protein